jgi:hypothetical protein
MQNHPAWFHLSGVVHAAERTFKAERLSIAGLVLMGSWLLAIALPPIERGSAGPPLKLLAWSLKRLLRWLVDRRTKRPSELRLRLAHELGVTRLAFSGAGAPGDHNGHGRETNKAHHSLLIHRPVICGCAKAGQRQGERAAYPHVKYFLFIICSFFIFAVFRFICEFPSPGASAGLLAEHFIQHRGEERMRNLILIAVTALGLAACAGPTLNGQSDVAQALPGEPHVMTPTGPYDNTVNSLGGRFAGTAGGN